MSTTNNKKRWRVHRPDPAQAEALARQLRVSVPVASVYISRGLDTPEKLEAFCGGSSVQYDPCLLPDMDSAVDRLVYAKDHDEPVLVHGDSDCDGICATALLVYGLQALTGTDPYAYIPNRLTEGFGLSVPSVERASQAGVRLIISCDCGTEAFDAADRARQLGIDLIITDHHTPKNGEVPRCVACINPKRNGSLYPFSDLAGVGVAHKLMEALADREGWGHDVLYENGMPLLALGTIADCVPLVGENRTLVTQGLVELDQTYMPGVREMMKAAGIRTTDREAVSFYLAPMANSSCRLGCPHYALRLLLEVEPVKARVFAHHLKELNDERKMIQRQMEADVLRSLPEDAVECSLLFASDRNWHPGLVGLIASKLASEFGKPSFIVGANSHNGDDAAGSCRSIPGVDVLQALSACDDLLVRYGGHPQAAGFQVPYSNLELLQKRLSEHLSGLETRATQDIVLNIDAELPLSELNMAFYEQVDKLAPFGQGNPQPVFATPHLLVTNATTFGKDGKHLRLVLTDAQKQKCIPAVYWGGGDQVRQLSGYIALVYNLTLDNYYAKPRMLLNILDWNYHQPKGEK